MNLSQQPGKIKTYADALSRKQRVLILIVLICSMVFSLNSEKYTWVFVTVLAIVLTSFGFSRHALPQRVNLYFSASVAKFAIIVTRLLVQIIYATVIAPLNLIVGKVIAKQNFRFSYKSYVESPITVTEKDFEGYY